MDAKPAASIDEYIALQSPEIRPKLEKIRALIKKTVPEATEVISYQMPSFRYFGMLAYFAAFTSHYTIFVSPPVLEAFRKDLKDYSLSKSGLKIPNNKPVPEKIVKEIIKFAAIVNLEKEEVRKVKKKMKA